MSGDNPFTIGWYRPPFQPFTKFLITDLNDISNVCATKQLSDLDLVSENLLGAKPAKFQAKGLRWGNNGDWSSIWYGYSAPNEGDIRYMKGHYCKGI